MKNVFSLFIKLIISVIMLICILLSFMSTNYFMTWLVMEVYSMSFIFIQLMSKSKKMPVMYYFIVNMLSSPMMLIYLIVNNNFAMMDINFLMFIAMMLKNGLFPFNNWMIYYFKNSSWFEIFMLSTLMKIIMLNLYFMSMYHNTLNILILLFSILASSISGLKKNSLKIIIAYSSISHTSILMILTLKSYDIFITYFIIYLISTMFMLYLFALFNINFNFQYVTMMNSFKFVFILTVFMYSCLPPFVTFILKWYLVENFFENMNMLILLSIVYSSMIMTWNYLNFNNSLYFTYNFKKLFCFYLKFNINNLIFYYFLMISLFFTFIYMYL